MKDLLNIDRTLIAVEKNKPDVIKVLSEIAYSDTRDPENKVRVCLLYTSSEAENPPFDGYGQSSVLLGTAAETIKSC